MEKIKQPVLISFWALISIFFVILCQFFLPGFENLFKGTKLFLAPMALFSLLGMILLILSLKGKIERKIKNFLILTGASSTSFFIFVALHNLFYALAIITNKLPFLHYLIEGTHVFFFLIAIFACPIGFLIGAIGTVIFLVKTRK